MSYKERDRLNHAKHKRGKRGKRERLVARDLQLKSDFNRAFDHIRFTVLYGASHTTMAAAMKQEKV